MTQWCDLDFAKGVRLGCQLSEWRETVNSTLASWSGSLEGSEMLKIFLGPLLRILLTNKKGKVVLSGYSTSWLSCFYLGNLYTCFYRIHLLLDERLVSQGLYPFNNASQKKMFLTSLWSPALGGYVCKCCMFNTSFLQSVAGQTCDSWEGSVLWVLWKWGPWK